MKLYTSTYRTYRGDKGVAISLGTPLSPKPAKHNYILKPRKEWMDAWNRVKHLRDTNPKKIKVKRDFTIVYIAKLDNLGIDRVLATLEEEDVLLCWCKPNEFCHRHILAKWLSSYGIQVEELQILGGSI